MGEERNGAKLYYYYDDGGQIIGLNYNGVNYYALRNLQGDVVALTDKNGTKVVSYVYDSWGQVISVTGSLKDTLGKDNPFRYRGYYYDEESGFYYLQSRYYDPETCRFLNADGYAITGQGFLGNNMFAYCKNNPSTFRDDAGTLVVCIGVSANATCIVGGSISQFFAIDHHGNTGSFITTSGDLSETPQIGLFDMGAGLVFQVIWDADTIYELEGEGYQMGASAGAGALSVGVDAVGMGTDMLSDQPIPGISVNVGVGAGIDVHIMRTKTERVYRPVERAALNIVKSTRKASNSYRASTRANTIIKSRSSYDHYLQLERKGYFSKTKTSSMSAYDFYEKYILGR